MRLATTCLTLLFTLLALAACGKKGPVRPLEERRPQAVQNAVLLQRGAGFQLRWKMPRHNQDGAPLTDLQSVEIEHLFSDPGEFCAECPGPWPQLARINPQLPAPARQVGELYLLSDQGAGAGQTARYRLTPRNSQGDAGLPLTLTQVYRPPQPGPTGLAIQPHDRSLDLSWQPVAVPVGAKLLGYQVYRRRGTAPFSPLPTNLKPLAETRFADFGLENAQTYSYRVRALFDFAGQQLESLPTEELSATPSGG